MSISQLLKVVACNQFPLLYFFQWQIWLQLMRQMQWVQDFLFLFLFCTNSVWIINPFFWTLSLVIFSCRSHRIFFFIEVLKLWRSLWIILIVVSLETIIILLPKNHIIDVLLSSYTFIDLGTEFLFASQENAIIPVYTLSDGGLGDWFGGFLYSAGQQANVAVQDQLSALSFTRFVSALALNF